MFEVGKYYHNNIGEYEVIHIKGDSMQVRYLAGNQQTLSIAIQSKIYERQSFQQTPKTKQQPQSYQAYWTLGFLANRIIHLGANITTEKEADFRDNYCLITGQELQDDQLGICFLRDGANQWGNQGVITFRATTNELLLLKFSSTPYPTNQQDTYEVKDIHYFWFALEHKFKLGGEQAIETTVKCIPSLYADAFDKGYTFASSNIKANTITP